MILTKEFILKRIKEQENYINEILNTQMEGFIRTERAILLKESARGQLIYFKNLLNNYK